jgi:predicted PurR-regulated permease PerM
MSKQKKETQVKKEVANDLQNEVLEQNEANNEPEVVIPEEIFKDAPPMVRQMLEMTVMSGRLPNPIANKLTPEHITSIIESSRDDDKRQFQDTLYSRFFNLGYVVIACVIFIFLVVFLKSEPEMLKDILKVFTGMIAGFGAGYAVKGYKKD